MLFANELALRWCDMVGLEKREEEETKAQNRQG